MRTTFSDLIFLTASQALFLWMFLATDPLEQAAATGVLNASGQDDAMRFAAAWRHGMAGNSPLYLPGFFLTAAAIWRHAARRVRTRRYFLELGTSALAALAIALLVAPWGANTVLQTFAARYPAIMTADISAVPYRAAVIGSYTLCTWGVFVVCSRAALVRRSWYPFIVPALLTVILVLIRPLTVDDFTKHWGMQIVEADAAAWLSLLAAIGLTTVLVRSERHGVQC